VRVVSRFAGVTLFLLWSLSLAYGQQVIIDFDRKHDFRTLKTYEWVVQEKLPIFQAMPDTPDVDLEELDKQIRAGIDKELDKRGFQKSTSGKPDFLISYIAVGELDLDVREYDSGTAPPDVPYGHWRPFYQTGNDVTLIRKGTLSIDIIDPEPNRLVWRGKATETFEKPKDLEKKLNKIVKKILKKFPPK
jgi:hypothetical protein